MRKEEEKEDRSVVYLHHKGSDPGPLRVHSSTDSHSAAPITSANGVQNMHTNLYAGTPTSGFKPLAEVVIFILFLM